MGLTANEASHTGLGLNTGALGLKDVVAVYLYTCHILCHRSAQEGTGAELAFL